jgi:hypothetical protein
MRGKEVGEVDDRKEKEKQRKSRRDSVFLSWRWRAPTTTFHHSTTLQHERMRTLVFEDGGA